MKVKLLRKINSRIRILPNGKNGYIVEKKNFIHKGMKILDWYKFREFKTIKEALHQKHKYARVFLYKDFAVQGKHKDRTKADRYVFSKYLVK